MDNINIYIFYDTQSLFKAQYGIARDVYDAASGDFKAINAEMDYARMLVQYHWRFVRRRIMQKH